MAALYNLYFHMQKYRVFSTFVIFFGIALWLKVVRCPTQKKLTSEGMEIKYRKFLQCMCTYEKSLNAVSDHL